MISIDPMTDLHKQIPRVTAKDLCECFRETKWSEIGDGSDLPSSVRNIQKKICICKEDSTLLTYGCLADSYRTWTSPSDSENLMVYDISSLYPSSALAGAILKDPASVDVASERYSLLRIMPDPHECTTHQRNMIEVMRTAPQYQEINFCVALGDGCRIFQGPSPRFSKFCKIMESSGEKKPISSLYYHFSSAEHSQVICILFTVGPTLNKLYVSKMQNKNPQATKLSDISVLRESVVKLASQKASKLAHWISRAQSEVDLESYKFIREVEISVLRSGPYRESPTRDTVLPWGLCPERDVVEVSRFLAPLNRMRMCSKEYALPMHKGKLSAYQAFLSSHMLPDHDCIEVSLLERLTAHIKISCSPQVLASASQDEKVRLLHSSIQGICPQYSVERMSLQEKLRLFEPLSFLCPGVDAARQVSTRRDRTVLCNGIEVVASVFIPDRGGRDLSLIELLGLEGVPKIEDVIADEEALSAWERHRRQFWSCDGAARGEEPAQGSRSFTMKEMRRLIAPIRYVRVLLCCPAGLADLALALLEGSTPLGQARVVLLQEHSNGCNLWVTVAAADASMMRQYREVYMRSLSEDGSGVWLVTTAGGDPSPHAIVRVEQACPSSHTCRTCMRWNESRRRPPSALRL